MKVENGICRYDMNMTDYAEVDSSEPEYLIIRSKFDGHVITKMHCDRLGIELSILHERMKKTL